MTNPGFRHAALACLLRCYPLLSGGGTIANHRWLRALAGSPKTTCAWARSPGGPLLAPLDDWVGRAVYFAGDLDRKVSHLCRRLLRPGDIGLDIGANIGLVTLLMARLVGPNGHVHLVEPNPTNLDFLRASLERNGFTNVTTHAVALGDQPGELELAIPAGNRGAASLVAGRITNAISTFPVPVVRLDDLPGLSGRPIRLMKIDVEGFEAQVLAGAGKLFATNPPDAVLFESNDGSSPATGAVFRALINHGYKIFAVPRRLFRLAVIPIEPNSTLTPGANDFIAVQPGRTDFTATTPL